MRICPVCQKTCHGSSKSASELVNGQVVYYHAPCWSRRHGEKEDMPRSRSKPLVVEQNPIWGRKQVCFVADQEMWEWLNREVKKLGTTRPRFILSILVDAKFASENGK